MSDAEEPNEQLMADNKAAMAYGRAAMERIKFLEAQMSQSGSQKSEVSHRVPTGPKDNSFDEDVDLSTRGPSAPSVHHHAAPSSSSIRFGTNTFSSAHTSVTLKPEIYSAR